jgi:hypothetical protein
MMNNDWRVFRASLVAQERAEKTDGSKSSSNSLFAGSTVHRNKDIERYVCGAINIFATNPTKMPREKTYLPVIPSVGLLLVTMTPLCLKILCLG